MAEPYGSCWCGLFQYNSIHLWRKYKNCKAFKVGDSKNSCLLLVFVLVAFLCWCTPHPFSLLCILSQLSALSESNPPSNAHLPWPEHPLTPPFPFPLPSLCVVPLLCINHHSGLVTDMGWRLASSLLCVHMIQSLTDNYQQHLVSLWEQGRNGPRLRPFEHS